MTVRLFHGPVRAPGGTSGGQLTAIEKANMGKRDTGADAIDYGTVVAPTEADIAAIEVAGESESDRKGVDEPGLERFRPCSRSS